MAKNEKESKNPLVRGIRSLNNITKATNTTTYGVGRDVASVLMNNVDDAIDKINEDSEKNKSLINSHMTRMKLQQSKRYNSSNGKDTKIYDIVNDSVLMDSVQTLVGGQNVKFSQLLKDYEIIKRCIPQIHKVITALKNNIISPDAMADSAIGIEMPPAVEKAYKDKIYDIIEDYKLNEKLQDWVMDYLIASVKYVTVVPYSKIPDMLEGEKVTIEECIEELSNSMTEKPKTLLECSQSPISIINESVELKYYEDDDGFGNSTKDFKISPSDLNEAVKDCLSGIEFIKGGENYFKNALLNEAVAIKNNMSDETSMRSILKRLKNGSSRTDHAFIQTSDGLIDDKKIKDIRKNVDFKGCHIEELNAAKTIPFKLRGTLIGYFYVEDNGLPGVNNTNNLSTIMDKINASVYMKHDTSNQAARVESSVIKTISERLISAIDAKFINDNYEDMDIIYEFVRANELHKKNKRVIFFHPDDVCEFKRSDGSIMKNCMFLAKLYILTMLSNVLTNVTRGSDRNIHYVKTGLTTDIEGHVNAAIRSIKQGQIRYSDIGTINEIFNIVGSGVDVFMPVSTDGEKPIETETISGQQVDMNNDFLNSMLKSIIQSFGVPSSVIDDFENIEFAKTISMSNLDMAKASLDAQKEINEPLTKLIRLIISYEIPEFIQVDEIYAKLNPPSVIIFEMNRERVDSINTMAEVLGNLLFSANDNETPGERKIRLFKLEYFKKNMPTLDWDSIEKITKQVEKDSKEEDLKNEIIGSDNDNYESQSQGGYGY